MTFQCVLQNQVMMIMTMVGVIIVIIILVLKVTFDDFGVRNVYDFSSLLSAIY